MSRLAVEEWRGLFNAVEYDAFHLELRDSYSVAGEQTRFGRWLAGEYEPYEQAAAWFAEWSDLVRVHALAGRTVRRLRVVTEPITPYIHFEWTNTVHNVEAGEDVRWLPRHQVSDSIVFPGYGNDFWLLDDRQVVFCLFDDTGRTVGKELVTDPDVVRECVQVRDRLWPLAMPHANYDPFFT